MYIGLGVIPSCGGALPAPSSRLLPSCTAHLCWVSFIFSVAPLFRPFFPARGAFSKIGQVFFVAFSFAFATETWPEKQETIRRHGEDVATFPSEKYPIFVLFLASVTTRHSSLEKTLAALL